VLANGIVSNGVEVQGRGYCLNKKSYKNKSRDGYWDDLDLLTFIFENKKARL
jgi:hypothetical protein